MSAYELSPRPRQQAALLLHPTHHYQGLAQMWGFNEGLVGGAVPTHSHTEPVFNEYGTGESSSLMGVATFPFSGLI